MRWGEDEGKSKKREREMDEGRQKKEEKRNKDRDNRYIGLGHPGQNTSFMGLGKMQTKNSPT